MVEQKWDIHHGHSLRSCLSATRPCVNGTEKDLLLVIRLAEAKRQRREKVNESSTPLMVTFSYSRPFRGGPVMSIEM